MKSKEELNALKEEVKTLNKKLSELTEEELKLVTGGIDIRGLEYIGPNTTEQKGGKITYELGDRDFKPLGQ